VKISALLSSAFFAFFSFGACGPSRSSGSAPGGPVAIRPDAGAPQPPVGALARADLLSGDWAVAGEAVPVVFLHPSGGMSAVYGVAAAAVPVIWVIDDAPRELAPEARHLEISRYQGEQVRVCTEKVDGGEGLIFGCEDGAGGLHFLQNGQALDVEEWTASTGPDQTHLVSADPAPAPELEDADLAFAADTAARGAKGWVAAYADDGIEWHGVEAVKGKPAIEADITPTLEGGALTWHPTVSRMLVAGALGVTAGVSHYAPKDGSEATDGTYVTLWRKDPTGWKVMIDTGRSDR
jgi:ketosteroid isomerase-like protein